MIGFCVACADDVAIGPDRRCLTDSSLVLPPSTGCAHQRWTGEDWSACTLCKPVAAGTWQKVLAPRDRPPEYQSTAVRRFSGDMTLTAHESRRIAQARRQRSQRYPTPEIPCPVCSKPFSERLSAHGSTRKTCSSECGHQLRTTNAARAPRREGQRRDMAVRSMACVGCGEKDRPHKARGLCQKCWSAERRRAVGAKVYAPPTTLEPVPCPVCSAPFKRVIRADGQRQKTCSKACGFVLKTGRRYLGERWSRQHDACVQCGTTASRHQSRGVCLRCAERARKANKQSEVAA